MTVRPLGPAIDPRSGDADPYEWFLPMVGTDAWWQHAENRRAWEADHPPWFDPRGGHYD